MKNIIKITLIAIVLFTSCKTEDVKRENKTSEIKTLQTKEFKNEKLLKVVKDSIPCEIGLSIYASRMNNLYLGVTNPINIDLSNSHSENIKVKMSNGSISKSGRGYMAYVKKPGKVQISVYDNGKLIGKKKFYCRYLPSPVVNIGREANNRRGGIIDKDKLVNMRMSVYLEDFNFDLKFNVPTHSVMAVIDGKEVIATGKGKEFSEAQKELISKVKIGRTVNIFDIKAKSPGGRLYNLGSLVYKLK